MTERYLGLATEKRDTVSSRFRSAADYLESHQLHSISQELSSLYPSPDDLAFRITLGHAQSYRHFVRDVQIKVKEGEYEFDIEDCGTGVQSQAIIALHRLLASLERRTIVMAIEEPETNLHPQAQQRFITNLRDSIGSDSQESQLVLTTHSTVVVDALSHEEVVLVQKIDDEDRGFHTEVSSLAPGFWARHGLDELQYQKYHQYRNSDFFYADLVLVVEGATEAEVIRRLFLREDIDLTREGVSILTLDGVRNLAYAYHLLDEIELPRVLIVDKDHFLPYIRDGRRESQDANGWPQYRAMFHTDSMIEHLVPNSDVRRDLLRALVSNHTRAMDLLEPLGIVCMRWALEVDLVASRAAREIIFDFLHIPEARRSVSALLVDRMKRIKRSDILLHVIDGIPLRSLPFSLSRVRRIVKARLRQR